MGLDYACTSEPRAVCLEHPSDVRHRQDSGDTKLLLPGVHEIQRLRRQVEAPQPRASAGELAPQPQSLFLLKHLPEYWAQDIIGKILHRTEIGSRSELHNIVDVVGSSLRHEVSPARQCPTLPSPPDASGSCGLCAAASCKACPEVSANGCWEPFVQVRAVFVSLRQVVDLGNLLPAVQYCRSTLG